MAVLALSRLPHYLAIRLPKAPQLSTRVLLRVSRLLRCSPPDRWHRYCGFLIVLVTSCVAELLCPSHVSAQGYGFSQNVDFQFPIPFRPLSPTSNAQCTEYQAQFQSVYDAVDREHESCLKASNKEQQIPGKSCSKPSCQSLHDYRDMLRARMSTAVDACRREVDAFLEQKRIEEERQRREAAERERQEREQNAKERERASRQRQQASSTPAKSQARATSDALPKKSLEQVLAEWRQQRREEIGRELQDAKKKEQELSTKVTEASEAASERAARQSADAVQSASEHVTGLQNSLGQEMTSANSRAGASAFDFSGVAGSSGSSGRLAGSDISVSQPSASEAARATEDAFGQRLDGSADRVSILGGAVTNDEASGSAWRPVTAEVRAAAEGLAEKGLRASMPELASAVDEVKHGLSPISDAQLVLDYKTSDGEAVRAFGRLVAPLAPSEQSRRDVADIARVQGNILDVEERVMDRALSGGSLTEDEEKEIDRALVEDPLGVVLDRMPIVGRARKAARSYADSYNSAAETVRQIGVVAQEIRRRANEGASAAADWAAAKWQSLVSATPNEEEAGP